MKRTLLFALLLSVVSSVHAQTRLEFWHIFGDENRGGWIQDRADEWNEMNPDFEMVPMVRDNYREALQAAVLAARQGEPPHLAQLFEIGSQLAVDSGIFMPVQEVIPDFDFSDYIEPVLNYYTLDGQINSIPFNSSSPILYTNRDMMAEAGLDPDSPPETYGEIIEACEALEAAGIDARCITFPLHSWFVEQWVAQQGALLANSGNGREDRATEVLLESDAMRTVVAWWQELNDRGFYTYTGALEDWSGSDAIFQEQRSMFLITSTANLGILRDGAAESGFELGTGRLPIPDDTERNGVVIGGASIWLTAGHPQEELEAAVDFVLYMTNTENMASWHQITGYYPVRNSSVEMLEAEGWFEENPRQTIAFTQLLETIPNEATAGAVIGSFLELRTVVGEAVQRVLGGGDIDTALTDAATRANEDLSEYNASVGVGQ